MGNWSFCCIQGSSEIVASRSSIRFGDSCHNKPSLSSDLESQSLGRRIQILTDKSAVSVVEGGILIFISFKKMSMCHVSIMINKSI